MHRLTPFLRLSILALATGLVVVVTGHAQTYADLVNDYATTGLPLTATGTGAWDFSNSTTSDPTAGVLTELTYTPALGGASNPGYGSSGGGVPGVSGLQIYPDGADPAGSFLTWHPGNSSPAYTVISWTAGAGESGPVEIQGTFSRLGEPGGGVNFSIYVNGVQAYTQTNVGPDNVYNFDLTASITTGESVSFVLDPNGDYFGDESLISATISAAAIPEPSTYAMLAGLGGLGLAVIRRHRRVRAA